MNPARKLRVVPSESRDGELESGVFRHADGEGDTFALHDAKNAACALRATLEWLDQEARTGDTRPEIRDGITEALVACAHLGGLLETSLETRRSRVDGLQLRCRPTVVRDLVQASVSRVRRRLDSERVRLDVRASTSDEPVALDPDLVSRVLDNLIDNAIRFSPRGGTIEIRHARFLSNLVISVSDEGPGVPVRDRERIFGMFQRGDEGPPSTGVGLAFCRSVAEAHRGCLEVDDAPGGGATFVLSLPAVSAPAR